MRATGRMVAPTQGRGLKRRAGEPPAGDERRPYTGARIETWTRGWRGGGETGRPYTGARIETPPQQKMAPLHGVAPTQGRGLKPLCRLWRIGGDIERHGLASVAVGREHPVLSGGHKPVSRQDPSKPKKTLREQVPCGREQHQDDKHRDGDDHKRHEERADGFSRPAFPGDATGRLNLRLHQFVFCQHLASLHIAHPPPHRSQRIRRTQDLMAKARNKDAVAELSVEIGANVSGAVEGMGQVRKEADRTAEAMGRAGNAAASAGAKTTSSMSSVASSVKDATASVNALQSGRPYTGARIETPPSPRPPRWPTSPLHRGAD